MTFSGLDRTSRVAINLARGDIPPKTITRLRHMARDGAALAEMAAAINWHMGMGPLRNRLRKLNITPGPAKHHGKSAPANMAESSVAGCRNSKTAGTLTLLARGSLPQGTNTKPACGPVSGEIKIWAYGIFVSAVKRGAIARRPTCERCDQGGKIDAHHEDYALPLDVVWLCRKCHKARHSEINRLNAAASQSASAA